MLFRSEFREFEGLSRLNVNLLMIVLIVRGLANCGIAGLVVFHAKNGITADDAETVEDV